MSFNPNQVSLQFKKSFAAPFVFVQVSYVADSGLFMKAENKPAWLKLVVEEDDKENKVLTYKVTVDEAVANNMSAGSYNEKVEFNERSFIFFGTNNLIAGPYFLTVNLNILDSARLEISKTEFLFSYEIGGALPPRQYFSLKTENAWSIVSEKPWVNFDRLNGQGTGNQEAVFINIDVNGLSPGIYKSNFVVEDATDQKSGEITLAISGAEEDENFLNVNKTGIIFSEILGEAPASSALISVSSSLDGTITTETPWLSLSTSNFNAGDINFTVSTQQTEALQVGSYVGAIKITTGYGSRVLNVLLKIVEIRTEGIESGGFYYALDRNELFLSTSQENAEAFLEYSTFTEASLKTYEKRIPFFENVVTTVVGLETSTFLKPGSLPEFNAGLYNLIKPLRMDLKVYDKLLNSTVVTERNSFTNLQFINGKTPEIENRLTYIPEKVTTNADGVICFSFIHEGDLNSISITGAVTQQIAVNKPAGKIFTAIVKLSEFNLKAQDRISITCGPVSVEVIIKPKELETYQIAWDNEWNLPEVINLDGVITINKEGESKTVTIAEAGREITKVIDVKQPASFSLQTGPIYSNREMEFLSSILHSRKIWLQLNGKRIEVIRKFSSLPVYETRNNLRNYKLNFDAAIK